MVIELPSLILVFVLCASVIGVLVRNKRKTDAKLKISQKKRRNVAVCDPFWESCGVREETFSIRFPKVSETILAIHKCEKWCWSLSFCCAIEVGFLKCRK
ncbi:PREDICTED: uncharacterized protein LOC101293955 [Fragaria vesca subsp. vesca]